MNTIVSSLLHITVTDVIDIAVIAIFFYSFLMLVRETRAEQLIKGLLFIIILWLVSEWGQLHMLNLAIRNLMTLGLIALVIVFQPELRRALEHIGRNRLFSSRSGEALEKDTDIMIESIVTAVEYLAERKIGALIALERKTGLADLLEAGTALDAIVSPQLLRSIFITSSPLHDGAVFVRNNRLVKAGAILPLTHDVSLSKDLGTRHRAALGLIERSDAIVVVVSEETGAISLAMDGKLSRHLDGRSLGSILRTAFKLVDNDGLIERFWGGLKRVKQE